MIEVTRLNRTTFVLNAEWIETVEGTPDTVITMVNGKRFVVRESVGEIVSRVVTYKNAAGYVRKTPFPDPNNPDYQPES
jgi:flagellar protein FlbD